MSASSRAHPDQMVVKSLPPTSGTMITHEPAAPRSMGEKITGGSGLDIQAIRSVALALSSEPMSSQHLYQVAPVGSHGPAADGTMVVKGSPACGAVPSSGSVFDPASCGNGKSGMPIISSGTTVVKGGEDGTTVIKTEDAALRPRSSSGAKQLHEGTMLLRNSDSGSPAEIVPAFMRHNAVQPAQPAFMRLVNGAPSARPSAAAPTGAAVSLAPEVGQAR